MKTPDEIKKALEIALNGCMTCDCCITDCPYDLECCPMNEDTNVDMPKQMAADALAYIQQLEYRIGELTEKVVQLESTQQKWISVGDRLPNEPGEVLACVFGRICIAWYSNRCFETPSGMVLYVAENAVTHWMPLPSKPEEGK